MKNGTQINDVVLTKEEMMAIAKELERDLSDNAKEKILAIFRSVVKCQNDMLKSVGRAVLRKAHLLNDTDLRHLATDLMGRDEVEREEMNMFHSVWGRKEKESGCKC